MKILIAKTACLNLELKFNPENGKCCEGGESWDPKAKKCEAGVGSEKSKPAKNCLHILNENRNAIDKMYWVKPSGTAFQVWCTFKGDYPGSALVIRRPGRVNGLERHTGARALPCTLSGGGDSRGYCKLHDNQINALKALSDEQDPFISLSYKTTNGKPFCRQYARKSCQWTLGGHAGSNCKNTPVRNSGNYCRQTNVNSGYRGMDGYYCNNGITYNSGNPFGNSAIHENTRPFCIWEHSGGTHYCGGHDTTWSHIELWIQ